MIDKSGKTIDELRGFYYDVSHMRKLDVRGADDMVKGFGSCINPLGALVLLRKADEYTFTHVVNVCILTMGMARFFGFKDKHLYQIGVAALLHDCGKFFISSDLTTKPGALTQNEREMMETHPVRGARYIVKLEGIPLSVQHF